MARLSRISRACRHCIIAFALAVAGEARATPAGSGDEFRLVVWEGAEVQSALTPRLAEQLNVTPTDQFDVVDDSAVLLTTDGNLLDTSRRKLVGVEAKCTPHSMAFSAGVAVLVCGDKLGWYQDGKLRIATPLPTREMRVVAGSKQRLLLYGGKGEGSIVYLLDDGRVLPLLDVRHGTISALASVGTRVFFAVGNKLYVAAKGERPALLFVVHGEAEIRSIAVDPYAGLVYISAGDSVYAMRAGYAVAILRGMEGYVRWSRTGLFVLDSGRKRLIKLTGLQGLTAPAMVAASGQKPAGFKE